MNGRGVRDVGVGPNIIDRVVGFFDPRIGLERARARVAMGAMSSFFGSAYDGGSPTRRGVAGWFTSRGSADVDVLLTLELMRQRSRDLIRNVPMATGAINTVVTSVVGTGLSLQTAVDGDALGWDDAKTEAWQKITEREFLLWAESTDCDITRTQDFYGLQDLVFRSTLENGDAFSILPYMARKGVAYDLRVQIIEADRVANKDYAPPSPTLAGGVKMDDNGAPVAYQILRQHPGGMLTAGLLWDEYPAFGAKTGRRNVLHHFRRVRPGQTRGVPYLAPVIEIIKQLGRYTDAEVMAAVVAGMFTVFVKSEQGGLQGPVTGSASAEGGTRAEATDGDIRMGYGTIADLAPGEEISTAAPGRPNPNFDPFFQACVRQIGMALEVPFEILIKHFTASYSAARAAMVEAWKFYRSRRAFLVQSFCQPIYEAWLEEAVAIGRIEAPGFFDDPALRKAFCGATWHGDAMPQIDPVKEVNAAGTRIAIGISDRARETAELTGGDWRTTHRQQVIEANLRRESGLESPPAAAAEKVLLGEAADDGGTDLETTPAGPAKPAPSAPAAPPAQQPPKGGNKK